MEPMDQGKQRRPIPPCGQCSRRDVLIERLFSNIEKLAVAAKAVEDAANPDMVPSTLMQAIYTMVRTHFDVACNGLEAWNKGIIEDDDASSSACSGAICGHERDILVIALEAWRDKPASFDTVLHMSRRERLAMMATDDPIKLVKIMTEAQQAIDERWTYVYEHERDHDCIVCCGPGERTELTIEEARCRLLTILESAQKQPNFADERVAS